MNSIFGMHNLFGMKIIEQPARYEPVLRLHDDAPVSDNFREETNAWLLDMFGTRDVSPISKNTIFMFNNTLLMRPETAVMLTNIGV